ncbi:hypothetical protein J7E88_09180 [Streptomyces sp. ISL-10]|uniref:hypothetical protein n=1 Tax=Streptomyces sp. ISL-10 TaxID=2819172 RepID=UPI001BE67ABA|nr:hypothetical protein [Streptomyces sp. ISL-10]MBT2365488.1 hypothetical protein [Streptomyces sp. ISL-10]
MVISGENSASGTALLLAAAPAGKGRLVDAASVLPALAAVPAPVLTGTRDAAATVIELADPLDPQTVLTRIRAAAAAPGPLFLYMAGQLHVDRRQKLLHFALARTTPATVRYTALPWHWLAGELRIRRPGTTTVVVDLVADDEALQQVRQGYADLGPGTLFQGRIAPAPGRRTVVSPVYLKAMAAIWRSGARPSLAQLHEQAAAQSGPADGALLFPLPSGSATAPTVPTAVSAVPAPAAPHPQMPTPAQLPGPAGPAAGAAERRDAAPSANVSTRHQVPARPAAADAEPPGHAWTQAPAAAHAQQQETARPAAVAAHPPGTAPPGPAAGAAARAPVATVQPAAAAGDPHPAILAAARAGRHTEAAAAAAACEADALRAYGPGSVQALHWLEVRADLARLAQDPARSCELWMAVADARLRRQQTADDPDVEGAVDRAHHQWEQIRDAARARRLAPELVRLRRRVPGRQRGALQLLQRRLEQLQSGPSVAT